MALGGGKVCGNQAAHFNGSSRSHSSNIPQSTAAPLGLGGIGQGIEKRLRL